MPQNTAVTLKKFFSTPEKPVSASEMMELWNSLTEAEKDEFRNADLGE